MRYRKPEELKEAGVEWIGKIPEHWDFERLKSTIKFCQNGIWGDSPEGDHTDIPCVRVADFDRFLLEIPNQDFTIRSVPKEKREDKVLQKGDLILEKSGGGEKQPVGAVMLYDLDIDAISSNFTARMPVRKGYDSSFLRYIHYHLYHSRVNTRSIKQTTGIQNLDSNHYLNNKVGLPPLSEQRAIAAFLDRKTEVIDKLIEKKEQLIERLNEKRQALITQAVTKGLDPEAKMKDSGVEWLGAIPEEWEIKRLKFLMETNPSKQEVSGYSNEFEVSFLPMEKVGETGELILDETKDLGKVINGYTYFTNGDVAVAKITPCFENGKGALLKNLDNGIGFGTTELTIFRPNLKRILPEYLYYITISYPVRKIGKSFMYGAGGQKRVPDDFFENFSLSIPTVEKQKEIISELSKKLERLSVFRTKILVQIDKLKEYRQSLISAAITGKIDVKKEEEVTVC